MVVDSISLPSEELLEKASFLESLRLLFQNLVLMRPDSHLARCQAEVRIGF